MNTPVLKLIRVSTGTVKKRYPFEKTRDFVFCRVKLFQWNAGTYHTRNFSLPFSTTGLSMPESACNRRGIPRSTHFQLKVVVPLNSRNHINDRHDIPRHIPVWTSGAMKHRLSMLSKQEVSHDDRRPWMPRVFQADPAILSSVVLKVTKVSCMYGTQCLSG
jgi:hypothetical protein